MTPAVHGSGSVLIVSESPFCLENGFGVTLNTLFQGWPADELFQLYTMGGAKPVRDVCQHIEWADVPGHYGRRYGVECWLGWRPAWRGRFSRRWLRRTLGKWRPDAVYALIFAPETLRFAAWIAREFDCPLLTHAADDGLGRIDQSQLAEFTSILAHAKQRWVISEEMRAEYFKRFGSQSEVLHNGPADALFDSPPRKPRGTEPFVVRYLGSIVPNHHFAALEDIAEAVLALNREGHSVRLELCGGEWTATNARQLIHGVEISHRAPIGKAEGVELLQSADLLIVPVTFAPEEFNFVRYSLPTKLTEYLATGTPTLVYGPAGTAPVEFCRRHSVGHLITERSVSVVCNFLKQCLADKGKLREDAEKDRLWIQKNYSGQAVREGFQARLRIVLKQSV